MHGRQAGHAAVCFREYFIVTDSNRPAYHLIFNPFLCYFAADGIAPRDFMCNGRLKELYDNGYRFLGQIIILHCGAFLYFGFTELEFALLTQVL